jgi:adenylate cyclase
LCDLRGFTSLSESLPRDELIEMLNQYFGPMCDAVDANNGEVLKFIGDAMLAIFPVIDG